MSDPRQTVPLYGLEYKRRPGDRETRLYARRENLGLRERKDGGK
jgi:hypothetical protein